MRSLSRAIAAVRPLISSPRSLIALIFVGASEVSAQSGIGIGTYMDPPDELVLQNHRIVSETTEPDGRIRVEFAADVHNTGGGTWHAQVTLHDEPGDHYDIVPGMAYIVFDPVDPNATVVAPVSLEALVDAAEIVGVRAALLSGTAVKFTGTEKFILNTPVVYVDADMNLSQLILLPDKLTFRLEPDPAPADNFGIQEDVETLESWAGHVLIEDLVEADRTLPLADPENPVPPGIPFAHALPFYISSVEVDEDSNKVVLHGARTDFSYVETGTVIVDDIYEFNDGVTPPRPFYQPIHGGTLSYSEKEFLKTEYDGTYPMGVERAVEDRLSLSENITVSGQTSLEGAGLSFRFKIRGGQLAAASADLSMSVATTLLLETLGEADNSSEDPSSQLAQIATIPLPPLPINIAGVPMSAVPEIRFSLGAEVDTPSALSMPVQTVTTQNIGMSWDATNGYSETNELTITPQISSDPNVMGQGAMSARVFAQAEFEVQFQFISGLPAGGGPFVGLEASGALDLDPAMNPWWSVTSEATLYHGMKLNVMGWTIAEQRWDLAETELGTNDAGGAALPLPTGFDAMRSHTAPDTRWMTLLHDNPIRGGAESGDIIQQFPNGDIMVLVGNGASSSLTKMRSNGERIWTKKFDWWEACESAAGTPDGGVVIVGKHLTGPAFIKRLNADGLLLWGYSFDDVPFVLTPKKVLVDAHPTTGDDEYVVLGYGYVDNVNGNDLVAMRLDAAGVVMWAYRYDKGSEDKFSGGCVASDGGILGVGTYRKWPHDLTSAGISENWLAMKLDRDGTPIWARGIPSGLGSHFFDVIETPDGSFLAAGHTSGAIAPEFRDVPTSTVARFSPNGDLLGHMFYCSGDGQNLGSPWDLATSIAWTPNGPVVCGNSSPQVGNFSERTGSWVMGLSENLGVRWHTKFEGPTYDGFLDILDAGDGLLLMGDVNGPGNAALGGSTAIYHLPYEGMVRFGEGFPDFESSYLLPRVVSAPGIHSDDPKNMVGGGTHGSNLLLNPQNYIQISFTSTQEVEDNELSALVESEMRFADFMVPTMLSSFDAWADYYQFLSTEGDPESDADGDGLELGIEFLTGGDPFGWDQNPIVGYFDGGMLALEMPLAPEVGLSEVLAERSLDLELWTEGEVSLELIDDLFGRRVRGETPMEGDEKQFLRFGNR